MWSVNDNDDEGIVKGPGQEVPLAGGVFMKMLSKGNIVFGQVTRICS
jgi:hypothetical protein